MWWSQPHRQRGLVITIAVIVKTAVNLRGWQINAMVAVLALMALVFACGLVAEAGWSSRR
jgi:Na+/serine symporter